MVVGSLCNKRKLNPPANSVFFFLCSSSLPRKGHFGEMGELNMSSSYHPLTDGQTKRLNQCVEAFLKYAVHAFPTKWSQWLPRHNIGITRLSILLWANLPMKCCLQGSQHILVKWTLDLGQSIVLDVQSWLQDRTLYTEMLHQQLLHAQQRMIHQANKHRTNMKFEVGDMVYLKLQPYVQMSMARRTCHKLSFRYFWAL